MTRSIGIPRTLRLGAWATALALAACQAYAARHMMNPDGLSYLDAARAFLAGDLATAVNPHWGPLYPAMMAAAFALVKPGIAATIPLVHAVNFAMFVVAFAAFDLLLRTLLRDRDDATPYAVFGYAVFLYAALGLSDLRLVTPDLLVMASVFAAASIVLRLRRNDAPLGPAALLGLVLAVGYFAKSVMFPLGLVFIGALVLLPGHGRRPWPAIAIASAVFLALSSLLIVPFSHKTGALTFGTAGKLAYAWEVTGIPYTNWQGNSQSSLHHPPTQRLQDPELFDYSAHLKGTYPPWFDPAYWNAGLTTAIRPWRQLLQLHRSTQFYLDLFLGSAAAIATLLAALSFGASLSGKSPSGAPLSATPAAGKSRPVTLAFGQRLFGTPLTHHPALLVPCFAALALYWPVHLEARYVAPFAALLWLVPVAGVRRVTAAAEHPEGREQAHNLEQKHRLEPTRWLGYAALVGGIMLTTPVAFNTLSEVWGRRDAPNPHPVVAAELQRLGVRPGSRVANVTRLPGENYGSSFEGYWAYLAGVQIVAEVPDQRDVICRDAAVTARVFRELEAVGAQAVVTRGIPVAACTAGWRPIEGTDFFLHLLSPPSLPRRPLSTDQQLLVDRPRSPDPK